MLDHLIEQIRTAVNVADDINSRPIIHDAPFEAHATLNVLGELCDGDVVTRADIDVRVAGIVLQKVDAGVGEIVDIEKLPPGSAAAPDDDLAGACELGFMKTAQQ